MLVHGFTQTARSWASVACELSAQLGGVEVLALDLPGHGAAAAACPASLSEAASRLASEGGRGVWVGYSMGARPVLRLALDQPGLVERLVLVGATAGIEDEAERSARRRADEALAARLEAIGVEAFLDEWLAGPLFAHLGPEQAGREERSRDAAGLAWALRRLGTGAEAPMWDRLHELSVPVLVVVGEHDAKFGALAAELARRIGPGATVVRVPSAGHAAPFEQPAAFAALVAAWLRGVEP